MIRVVFRQDSGGRLIGFKVSGHAGYAPPGRDIVCAAVSALAQTAVLSLQEQLEEGPRVSIREGTLACYLPDTLGPDDREKARVILRTIELGLQAIAGDYHQYVTMDYR